MSVQLCGAPLLHLSEHSPFFPWCLWENCLRHPRSDPKAIEEPPSFLKNPMGFIFKMELGYHGALTFLLVLLLSQDFIAVGQSPLVLSWIPTYWLLQQQQMKRPS